MIRIITDGGVSLDIDPSAEFEIEYENPMLDDSHLPVPFSTSIALLPTPRNCKVLGYLAAMMLEPSVKKISASIEIRGIPLFFGVLEYDGIDDGKLNYTFSGRNVETEWEKKIWQLDILKYKGEECPSVMTRIIYGNEPGICAPLLIDPEYVAKSVYKDKDGNVEQVDVPDKYINSPVDAFDKVYSYDRFMPVVDVDRILAVIADSWTDVPSFTPLSIIGRYSLSIRYFKTAWRGLHDGLLDTMDPYKSSSFDIAETLPDMSLAELVKNLARMRCASIYYDGEKVQFMTFDDVLKAAPEDWDEKVADNFTAVPESGCRYVFGFSDDSTSSYPSSKLSKELDDDTITDAIGYSEVLAAAGDGDYSPARNKLTGDIYSGKYFSANGNKVYLEDMIFHNVGKRETSAEDNASSFDATADLIPVSAVPDVLYSGNKAKYRVAPLVPPLSADSERDSKVYIGYVYDGQMSDSGYTLGADGKERLKGVALPKLSGMYNECLLSPDNLWEEYHKNFASWISRDRQCVTADLDLSVLDISSFRMYRLVCFRGRRWIVKKLTLTFRAGSDAVSTRGEFISYDV